MTTLVITINPANMDQVLIICHPTSAVLPMY